MCVGTRESWCGSSYSKWLLLPINASNNCATPIHRKKQIHHPQSRQATTSLTIVNHKWLDYILMGLAHVEPNQMSAKEFDIESLAMTSMSSRPELSAISAMNWRSTLGDPNSPRHQVNIMK